MLGLSIEILVTSAGREPLTYLRVMRCVLFSTAVCGAIDSAVEVVGAGCLLMYRRMVSASALHLFTLGICGVRWIFLRWAEAGLLSAIAAPIQPISSCAGRQKTPAPLSAKVFLNARRLRMNESSSTQNEI